MVFSLFIFFFLIIVIVILFDFQILVVKMCISFVDWQGQFGYVYIYFIKKIVVFYVRYINIEKLKKSYNLYQFID